MKFSDITGVEYTKQTLINSVKNNHIAHAQLFLGKDGSANLALALAYAQYINCTAKTENDSCGTCPSCIKFSKLIHPDFHFIFPTSTTKKVTKSKEAISQSFMKEWRSFIPDNPYPVLSDWAGFFGAENKQCNISKEESRNIIRSLSLKAFEAEYKVMLIWLPEFMHPAAANAILKILEEPPAKTLFFLVSNDADKLLTTILSRTQIIQVPQFTDQEISNILQEEYQVEEERAKHIAYLAEGNLNEAVKLSDEVKNISADFFKQWMRICFKNDFTNMLKFADDFQKMGKEDQKSLFQYSLNIFRESLLWKFADPELVRLENEELEFVKNFSKVLNENNLEMMVNKLNQSLFHIERNANPKILFTNLSIFLGKLFRIGA